jgi:hypothetical protein
MLVNVPPSIPKKDTKEMLRVQYEEYKFPSGNGHVRPVVYINNSSLDLIMTCPRKAYYLLERKLVSAEEAAAKIFGLAIHKGLQVYYGEPRETRNTPGNIERAVLAFEGAAMPLTTQVDVTDKRSPGNGARILEKYFKSYADDNYAIVRDEKGEPYVERRFEFVLVDTPDLKIILFGTIDVILQELTSKVIYVTDHKTTSALGTEFNNRVKPNHQYTGYVMGAQKAFGLKTNLFMVNGIQVAKTKIEFSRLITDRNEDDFAEFTQTVTHAVKLYLDCKAKNEWAMNAPNPCTMYGGCAYRILCSSAPSLREQMIPGLFNKQAENG